MDTDHRDDTWDMDRNHIQDKVQHHPRQNGHLKQEETEEEADNMDMDYSVNDSTSQSRQTDQDEPFQSDPDDILDGYV